MKHNLAILTLAAVLAGAPPASAGAQCVDDVIAGCDRAFPLRSALGTPFRGWCYLAGLANCAAS